MNPADSQRTEAPWQWSPSRAGETRWAELVELYEYKVGDLIAGRIPRGGKRSLGDLRDLLVQAPLEGALLRRFGHTDRIWRAHLKTLTGASTTLAQERTGHEPRPGHVAGMVEGLGDDGSGASLASEQRALEDLRFAVWREAVRNQSRLQTQQWLREPDLVTLRSAYALSVNLERGENSMRVPHARDPLASLGTPSVAERMVAGLADQVCLAFAEPRIHEPGALQQALTRLRAAVTELSLNPFPRHPDQDVIESRVQAAEREGLGQTMTRTLIDGLQAEVGGPRSAGERLSIKAASARLSQFVENIIPVSEGGNGPELPGVPRVLYAATPRAQLPAPDDGSTTLTIHLSGGSQAHWRGVPLRWKRAGEGWLVAIGPLEYRLVSRAKHGQPDPEAASIAVTLGDTNGQALLHGDYLYIAAHRNDRGLLELLALARECRCCSTHAAPT